MAQDARGAGGLGDGHDLAGPAGEHAAQPRRGFLGVSLGVAHPGGGAEHEQSPQRLIALLGDASGARLAAGAVEPRCQPKPGGKVAAALEERGIRQGGQRGMCGRPPFRKGFCNIFWREVGAVMCPACLCGRSCAAGHDGILGRFSNHPDALWRAMTARSVPGPVCLPISPSVAAVLLAKGWAVSRWLARDRVGCA